MRFGSRVVAVVLSVGMTITGAAGLAGSASASLPHDTSGGGSALVTDPASLVNPLIGTGSGGAIVGDVDTFPGADVPFGMMQWSPDTSPDRTDGGGYFYSDSQISGFSLTHLSGPGCSAFGDIPILPTVGAIGTDPSATTEPFSHSTEHASPGYYEVQTGSPAVNTQLTVTPRTGIGKFTFPSSTESNLIIKAGGSESGLTASNVQIVGDNEVTGDVTAGQFCGASGENYTLHFVIQFQQSFVSSGSWNGSTVTPGAPSGTVSGTNTGAWVTFNTTSTKTVTAKVGISFTDAANAALNLSTEDPGWSFSSVHTAATASWNKLLGEVQVGGGTRTEQTTFYTALYHSLLMPNVFSDVNGQYMGYNGKIQTVPAGHANYANYSGWDIYRSEIQLISLLDPSVMSDIVNSMLDDYTQTGQFPKWSLANGETYVMVGDPADGIIADAYAFGVRGFDTSTALADMVQEATVTNNNRPGLNYLEQLGYLPTNGSYGCCNFYGAASTTLEYDTADAAIGSFAKSLGDGSIATKFATRAQDWQNLYNPANGFIEPKTLNGQWVSDFDPTSEDNYVEGDAYQYNWMVPYNVGSLVDAEGGGAAFTSRLNTYFQQLNAGPNSPYDWAGNEPNLETPWEYDYAGTPYRTQDVVRQIITQTYSDTPGGEPGNDDLGAMASWYAWAAMGLFPETPGDPMLVVGSPLFPRTVIHVPGGNTVVIDGHGAAGDAPYVHSLSVNGKSTQKTWLPASDLLGTGRSGSQGRAKSGVTTLDFSLGTKPDTHWGSQSQDAPPSISTGEQPAIGYLTTSQLDVAPGHTATTKVSVQNMTARSERVRVTATPASGSGVSVSPSPATLSVAAASSATESLKVTAAPSAPQTFSTVSLAFAVGHTDLPGQSLTVLVAPAGALSRLYNNVGISDDSNPGTADFDGGGRSYSAEALAKAGLTPGATVSSGGVTYTWPNSPAGYPDNIEAAGQVIPFSTPAGAQQLGFLGAASDGPLTGPLTLTYTDGTVESYQLGLSDWTLNGGTAKPSYGNTVVASTTYRNTTSGTDDTATDVFATAVPLDPTKTLASVTLPPAAASGALHIFDMAASTTAMTGAVALSLGPNPASAGTKVTVTGSGFGATQGSGYVAFSDAGTNWGQPGNLGSFTVDSWSNTSITFTVPEPSGTDGVWHVWPGTAATVTVVNGSGSTSDTLNLAITPTANPSDYYNNTGISSDTDQACANMDGDGYSLSQQALAAAGVTAGGTVTSGGISYTWPSPVCAADNILADGQTMLVNGASGDTTLGLLTTATNGPVTGDLVVHYSDGTTSTDSITVNDWANGPSAGNTAVATMPYRNSVSGTSQTLTVYVYAVTVPLTAGKTVTSITLPSISSSVSGGAPAMHVYAVGLGS